MKWPRVEPAAVGDIEQAVAHHAKISSALEAAFAKAVRDALSQIARSPRRYARLETNETNREVRRVILWRFNYLVIYEVVHDVPIVLAVMHASRQPDAWRLRESGD